MERSTEPGLVFLVLAPCPLTADRAPALSSAQRLLRKCPFQTQQTRLAIHPDMVVGVRLGGAPGRKCLHSKKKAEHPQQLQLPFTASSVSPAHSWDIPDNYGYQGLEVPCVCGLKPR